MAGNYWASTQHRYWETTRQELDAAREADRDKKLEQQFPLPERRIINLYLQQQITKLGRKLSSRQIVLATAQVFVSRYYSKVDFRRSNPFMIVTTAVYLSCKIEECPQHIRVVATAARDLWPDYIQADTVRIGESEFGLISQLNAQLVVHHPYHALSKIQQPFAMTQEEVNLAWSIINDHYITDLPLLHPPRVITVAAALLAIVGRSSTGSNATGFQASRLVQVSTSLGNIAGGRGQKIVDWLSESDISTEAVVCCTQELVSLYALLSSNTMQERHMQAETGLKRISQARQ